MSRTSFEGIADMVDLLERHSQPGVASDIEFGMGVKDDLALWNLHALLAAGRRDGLAVAANRLPGRCGLGWPLYRVTLSGEVRLMLRVVKVLAWTSGDRLD